jgi:hypothetical protein
VVVNGPAVADGSLIVIFKNSVFSNAQIGRSAYSGTVFGHVSYPAADGGNGGRLLTSSSLILMLPLQGLKPVITWASSLRPLPATGNPQDFAAANLKGDPL